MPTTSMPQLVNTYDEPSDSNPGLSYLVSEWANGALTCECPSFIRGKQQRGKDLFDRTCKHTDRVRARLQNGGPAPAVKPLTSDPFKLLEKEMASPRCRFCSCVKGTPDVKGDKCSCHRGPAP